MNIDEHIESAIPKKGGLTFQPLVSGRVLPSKNLSCWVWMVYRREQMSWFQVQVLGCPAGI